MEPRLKLFAATLIGALAFLSSVAYADPLPSWNDTAPKKAIIAFVEKVTTAGSPDYVVPAGIKGQVISKIMLARTE